MSGPPPLPGQEPSDWWARNWKWFLPVMGLVSVLVIAGCAASIFAFIKSSDAYTGALARARSDPAVVAAIGMPIKDAYFVSGNINVTNDTGLADLAIPVSGPKGGASIFVHASKRLGVWHFDRMIVEVNSTRQKIDLSEIPAAGGQSSQ